jgi:hypothetical protein
MALASGTKLGRGARISMPRLAADDHLIALRLENPGVLLNKLEGSPLVAVSPRARIPDSIYGEGKSLLVAERTGYEIVLDLVILPTAGELFASRSQQTARMPSDSPSQRI